MANPDLVFDIFRPEHFDKVFYLLVDVFPKEEPLARALGVTYEALEPFRNFLGYALFWQVSYVAVERKTEEVVGILMNTLSHYNDVPIIPKHYHLNYRMMLGFINYAFRDLFATLNDAHVVLKLETLAVHPRWRGKGVARELVEASVRLGRSIRCQYAVSLPTPLKSQNLFYKKGFSVLKTIDYDTYQELDGSYPLKSIVGEEKAAKVVFLKLF